jgi:hypothetical protein
LATPLRHLRRRGLAAEEVTAEYTVSHTGLTIGRISETFVRNGDTYSAKSVTRSEGPLKAILDEQITLESSGRLGSAGLQPLEFVQRRAKDSKRDLRATSTGTRAR